MFYRQDKFVPLKAPAPAGLGGSGGPVPGGVGVRRARRSSMSNSSMASIKSSSSSNSTGYDPQQHQLTAYQLKQQLRANGQYAGSMTGSDKLSCSIRSKTTTRSEASTIYDSGAEFDDGSFEEIQLTMIKD